MEHGHIDTNTQHNMTYDIESPQDEGEVDTIGVGSPKTPESSLLAEQLENSNDVETKSQGEKKEKWYTCKFCGRIFSKHQALGGHMNGHSPEERNLEKLRKFENWKAQTAFLHGMNVGSSESMMQQTPTNQASYNQPRETDGVHSQLGQPGNTWTNQQSPQQIQFFSGLQAQQRQGYQNYQASQGQRQQGPSDFNNQLRPIFNPSMPNSAITSARVPPSIQMGNSSYTQGPRPHQGIAVSLMR